MRTVELSASQCEVGAVQNTAYHTRSYPVCPAGKRWKRRDAAFLAALNSHWANSFLDTYGATPHRQNLCGANSQCKKCSGSHNYQQTVMFCG